MSAASDQKLFCKLCAPFCCSFDEFVEKKVISPSYSSAIFSFPILNEPLYSYYIYFLMTLFHVITVASDYLYPIDMYMTQLYA